MQRNHHFLTYFVLLLVFVLVMPLHIQAAPAAESEILSITVPFVNVLNKQVLQWNFPYSDAYFLQSSNVFSRETAKASLGLAISAFHSENDSDELKNQYETYLKNAGFQDIHAFGYDQETSKDTLSGVIGWKQIDDFILIAAAPCGQGYEKEWAGNLEVGDEERHVGFNRAAGIMEEQIRTYIETYHLDGKRKLWISGFSRAAATANLTAADMIDAGLFEDVYAYLFGVPRTTKAENYYTYTGIYNICGKNDPVTQVPAESWGYHRYGSDLYLPSMETDSEYFILKYNAGEVSYELKGTGFWYNPETNYQLHLIIEFLAEMFPTNAEFAEKFQGVLMELWTESNPDTIALILTQALSQLEDLDSRQEYSSEILIDYLTYLSAQHLKEDQEQIERGFWNPEEGIAENVMREHTPYTYLDWVFSDTPPASLYYGPQITRRIYFYGDLDLEVWKNGTMINGINRNGDAILPDTDNIGEEYWNSDVLMIRNGTETMTCIPYDGDYQIRIRVKGLENIFFYEIICDAGKTFGEMDTMYHLITSDEEYVMNFPQEEEGFTVKTADGELCQLYDIPYQYSPTMVMSGESNASSHLTITGLLALIAGIILFVLLLLFVCMIIAIVHAVRKRKRSKPYSPWFVIVPHLILVVLFTILTQFFTSNLFSIGFSRVACAGITMAVIFLLALRGLIRNRNIKNLVITVVLLGITVLNVFLYQKSSLVSASLTHCIIYFVCMAGLCALAISTFYTGKRKKTKNIPEAA